MLEYPNGNFLVGNSLVLFYAGYHSNCNITLNMLYELERKYNNIKFFKLNTSRYYKIKEKYNIKILPAILYFKDGILKDKILGNFNSHNIKRMLEVN